MLRSSREGRKQAARFHAFPSVKSHIQHQSHPSVRDVFTTLAKPGGNARPILPRPGSQRKSSTYASPQTTWQPSDRPKTKATTTTTTKAAIATAATLTREGSDVESETTSLSSITTEMEIPDLTLHHKEKHDIFVRIPGKNTADGDDDTQAPVEELLTVGTTQSGMVPHPNVLSLDLLHEKTSSRETTEDQSQTSSLSSPPTSHLDDGGEELDSMRSWAVDLIDGKSLPRAVSISSDSDDEDCTHIKPRQRYSRFEPRSVEGASLIDDRSRRVKVKSKKMMEAEETLAISPTGKRRSHVGSSSLSSSSRRLSTSEQGQAGSTGMSDVTVANGHRSTTPVARSPAVELRSSQQVTGINEIVEPVKRKRGRPLGSTKQKAKEEAQRKADEQAAFTRSILRSSFSKNGERERHRQGMPLAERVQDDISVYTVSSTDSVLQRRSARRTGSSEGERSVTLQLIQAGTSNIKPTVLTQTPAAKVSDACAMEGTKRDKTDKPQKALWKRKVFLSSGLYSKDYKNEEVTRRHARKSLPDVPDTLARGTPRSRKVSHMSTLPLPTDFGAYLLEEKRDFRLPFHIAQRINELRDKQEAKKKPPPYNHISRNRYFSRAKLPGEILICQCPADGDCGETCVNRQTEYLCNPKHCPCGERCTNIYFGKRKAVKTEVQWYGARGFGLKTLEPIAKGAFIDEYRGEVIDYNEAVRRIRDHYKAMGNYYFLMYDAPAGEMLDGGLKGNITRFANHSCDPNCKVQKWLICGTDEARSGEFQVALFAERDIAAGEELTYDYGWSAFAAKAVSEGKEATAATPEACHCGAANCSGFLGVKKQSTAAAAVSGSSVASKALKKIRKKKRLAKLKTEKKAKSVDNMRKSSLFIVAPALPPASSHAIASNIPVTPKRSSTIPSPIGSRKGLLDQVAKSCESPADTSSLSSLSDDEETISHTRLTSELSPPVPANDLRLLVQAETPFGRLLLQRKREREVQLERDRAKKEFGGPPQERDAKEESVNKQVDEVKVLPPSSASTMTSTSTKRCNDMELPNEEAQKPKKRLKVSDRVISVWVPVETLRQEAKKKEALIVEGKRDRRLSLKASEQAKATEPRVRRIVRPSRPNVARTRYSVERVFPRSKQYLARPPSYHSYRDDTASTSLSDATSTGYKGPIKDPYHGLRNASGSRFSPADYPSGTIFYDRWGDIFDFEEYRQVAMHKRGSKPMIYTKEEQLEYIRKLRLKVAAEENTSFPRHTALQVERPI